MSLRRTKARSRESYFLGLPFDSRRTQEMQRSTSVAMINSVYDSLGKIQIQLVLHSHGSVDMAPLLALATSDSFARFYTCGMRCDKCFCFAVQNDHLKFHKVVLTPKRAFNHSFGSIILKQIPKC